MSFARFAVRIAARVMLERGAERLEGGPRVRDGSAADEMDFARHGFSG
jgi:hypothetical protein